MNRALFRSPAKTKDFPSPRGGKTARSARKAGWGLEEKTARKKRGKTFTQQLEGSATNPQKQETPGKDDALMRK